MAGTSHWHVDCQLLAWDGESSSHGPTIKLLFQEEGDLDFFKAMTLHKGRFFSKVGDKKHVCGQILKCAFELSDDDDQKAEMAEPVVAKARPQEDWIRCPDCDEHSRNLEGSACFTCGGTGMVKKKRRHMSAFEVKVIDLCKHEMFQKFVSNFILLYDKTGIGNNSNEDYYYDENEKGAREYILDHCGVSHRYMIEKSKDAAINFGKIEKGFNEWLQEP